MTRIELIASLILMLIFFETTAQYGYVKLLKTDSIIGGYIREFRSDKEGRIAMEVWRTKTDKNPMRFYKNDLIEYAIRKDTFRVLQNYKPFEDEKKYFDLTDALLISKGKINLLRIDFLVGNYPYVANEIIYILEERETGYMRAIPNDEKKMNEQLLDFFTEGYLNKYVQSRKRISYKTIPDLVRLYNSM